MLEPQIPGTFKTYPDLYRDCFTRTFYKGICFINRNGGKSEKDRIMDSIF